MDKPRVIFVDDEKDNLVGFKASYSKFYNIDTVLNGGLAIDLINKQNYDVVLVDYKMPEKDGLSLIQKIRVDHPELTFIVVTAFADIDVVIRALEMHCIFSFVQKPWNHEELKNTIDRAVEMSRFRRENRKLKDDLILKNKRLEQALEKEKKLNEYRLSFIRNLSHEVRTPLNGILGFTSVARSMSCKAELSELINLSVDAGDQLLRTFENILVASEIFSGETGVNPARFEMNRLLSEVVANLVESSGEFPGRQVEMNISQGVELFQDRDKLKAVVYQVLHNALKFSREQAVRLSVTEKNRQIIIEIADSGVGIAPRVQKNIFEPFFQEDASLSRRFPGNGLGLFIASSFVTKLKGELKVDSKPGRGTVVSVILPLEIATQNGEVE
jgi:signal transduction histidine kinase